LSIPGEMKVLPSSGRISYCSSEKIGKYLANRIFAVCRGTLRVPDIGREASRPYNFPKDVLSVSQIVLELTALKF